MKYGLNRDSGQEIDDHFVDVNKMIPMPKGASVETW